MKKVLIFLLAALLILPVVSCAKKDGETTGENTTAAVVPDSETEASTVDDRGFIKDDLPDNLNFDTEINVLYWDDYTMTEFFVDEPNGNNIDSAIYSRNLKVEDRLGVSLKYTGTPGSADYMTAYTAKVAADFKSDHFYDIYATYSRTPPALSLSGYLRNLNSIEYFNSEKPWWPKALVTEVEINGKLYFASGDISTNMLWMMIGTFYNRKLYEDRMADELFSETPEELVKQNKWTLERLFKMTGDIYEDMNTDGKKDSGDSYGMIIYTTNIDAFQTAAGITSIIKNPDGHLSVSPDFEGERGTDLCQLVGDFIKKQGVYNENSTKVRDIFFEERAIFCMDRCFIVAGKDNHVNQTKIDFSFGIVPQPKYTEDQEDYGTNLGHPFTMYCVSDTSHDVDASGAVLEALGSESYRLVTPEVFESTMKVRYADGAEVAEMYDTLRRTVSFDIGRLYAGTFGNTTANGFRTNALNSPASYYTNIQRSLSKIKSGIKTIEDYSFGN